VDTRGKVLVWLGVVILITIVSCRSGQYREISTVTPPPDVIVTRDVPYSTGSLLLDVYSPSEPGMYPVVVGFHGCPINKTSLWGLGHELARRGVVVFSVGWSCAPTVVDNYLVGEREGTCAIKFVRQHAYEYQGDPSRIIVVGHSGGGGIGAAITLGGDSFVADCLVNTGSALPDGFVGLDGAYPLYNFLTDSAKTTMTKTDLDQMDPFYQITANPVREEVPFRLFVGDEAEELIQFSRDFHQALLDAGYDSELTLFSDVSHMGIIGSTPSDVIETIVSMARGE
jgi:acetyl esterase/lipase